MQVFDGVEVRSLAFARDNRGWLVELFRGDLLAEGRMPAMCYVSLTRPGIARGPHEHKLQTDLFCFLGPSNFLLVLWDNRQGSATYGLKWSHVFGEAEPAAVMVPPGVVHGYRNVGDCDGLVVNLPDRLFKGRGRADPVDEIRHEADESSPFVMER